MIEDLKFVQGAVARRDYVQALTHFNIHNGRIQGYNGTLALSSPIQLNLNIKPKATEFAKAVQTCKETVQINLTPAGRLSIKSGRFRALINCIEDDFPDIEPEGEEFELEGGLLDALKTLNPFIGEDASRPWSRGVLFSGSSAFATNNIILMQYWLGHHFPYVINIPKPAIQEILRIGKEPTGMQVSPRNITFHYEGGRWLRSQLYSTKWPDLNKVLSAENNPAPFPDIFFEALEDLTPFMDDMSRVYFKEGKISTHEAEGEGATVEIKGLPDKGIYNIKLLKLLYEVAEKIDFNSYPKPSIFIGEKLRGAIVGMRT